MKIASHHQSVVQKSFANKKPVLRVASPQALEAWEKNISAMEGEWRNAILRARVNRKTDLRRFKRDFFRARFLLERDLDAKSNLPHEATIALKKRLFVLANEIKGLE